MIGNNVVALGIAVWCGVNINRSAVDIDPILDQDGVCILWTCSAWFGYRIDGSITG